MTQGKYVIVFTLTNNVKMIQLLISTIKLQAFIYNLGDIKQDDRKKATSRANTDKVSKFVYITNQKMTSSSVEKMPLYLLIKQHSLQVMFVKTKCWEDSYSNISLTTPNKTVDVVHTSCLS